jgi:hypothetical protein
MVKGKCKGKKCDFWARVKLRKSDLDDMVRTIVSSLVECRDNGKSLEDALYTFWNEFGIKDMATMFEEEPDLKTKVTLIENRVQQQLRAESPMA